jgi:hypothetical protein
MQPIDVILIVLSVLTTAFTVCGMQFKNMKWIILCQILSNFLLGLQCIIGGTISTGGVVMLATVQTVLSFALNYKKIPFPAWLTVSFMVGYSAITVIGFLSPSVASSPFDLITMVAVWCFAISIVQEKSWICRFFLALNVSLWLIYDFAVLPSAALNHIIILSSIFFAMVRNDRADWKSFLRQFLRK